MCIKAKYYLLEILMSYIGLDGKTNSMWLERNSFFLLFALALVRLIKRTSSRMRVAVVNTNASPNKHVIVVNIFVSPAHKCVRRNGKQKLAAMGEGTKEKRDKNIRGVYDNLLFVFLLIHCTLYATAYVYAVHFFVHYLIYSSINLSFISVL